MELAAHDDQNAGCTCRSLSSAHSHREYQNGTRSSELEFGRSFTKGGNSLVASEVLRRITPLYALFTLKGKEDDGR
jgi:hypothetical protein